MAERGGGRRGPGNNQGLNSKGKVVFSVNNENINHLLNQLSRQPEVKKACRQNYLKFLSIFSTAKEQMNEQKQEYVQMMADAVAYTQKSDAEQHNDNIIARGLLKTLHERLSKIDRDFSPIEEFDPHVPVDTGSMSIRVGDIAPVSVVTGLADVMEFVRNNANNAGTARLRGANGGQLAVDCLEHLRQAYTMGFTGFAEKHVAGGARFLSDDMVSAFAARYGKDKFFIHRLGHAVLAIDDTDSLGKAMTTYNPTFDNERMLFTRNEANVSYPLILVRLIIKMRKDRPEFPTAAEKRKFEPENLLMFLGSNMKKIQGREAFAKVMSERGFAKLAETVRAADDTKFLHPAKLTYRRIRNAVAYVMATPAESLCAVAPIQMGLQYAVSIFFGEEELHNEDNRAGARENTKFHGICSIVLKMAVTYAGHVFNYTGTCKESIYKIKFYDQEDPPDTGDMSGEIDSVLKCLERVASGECEPTYGDGYDEEAFDEADDMDDVDETRWDENWDGKDLPDYQPNVRSVIGMTSNTRKGQLLPLSWEGIPDSDKDALEALWKQGRLGIMSENFADSAQKREFEVMQATIDTYPYLKYSPTFRDLALAANWLQNGEFLQRFDEELATILSNGDPIDSVRKMVKQHRDVLLAEHIRRRKLQREERARKEREEGATGGSSEAVRRVVNEEFLKQVAEEMDQKRKSQKVDYMAATKKLIADQAAKDREAEQGKKEQERLGAERTASQQSSKVKSAPAADQAPVKPAAPNEEPPMSLPESTRWKPTASSSEDDKSAETAASALAKSLGQVLVKMEPAKAQDGAPVFFTPKMPSQQAPAKPSDDTKEEID